MPVPGRLGRYVLHRVLGEGGMGVVWEATLVGPAGFRKRVALKVLKAGGHELAREARLGGLLQHPNLVEVYALEQVEGQWLCAMELVNGGSLAQHLPLSPQAAVEAAQQVARGLAHAHDEVGLVHLDLKPANLLLGHGLVKVADLGISRARGFAQLGGVVGTPAYMAPEHLAGRDVDVRADIYALGVVIVELVTGAPGDDPVAVPVLTEVLSRCLALDRERRFGSMVAVAEALEALASTRDLSGPPLAEVVARMPDRARGTETRDTFELDGVGAVDAEPMEGDGERFVGRARELGELLDHAAAPGLVTLKGLGGIGKTRLARRLLQRWPGPGLFVDLRAARSRAEVLVAVAESLDVPVENGSSDAIIEALGATWLARGDVLAVFDNMEQVVEHADILERWCALAPRLRLLVTSRERLHLRGERVVELGPLPAPDAAELLVCRARARGRDIAGDPVLPELVRRLDALPLALELAASRLGLLTPAQILARLHQRFDLLRSRARDIDPRHATLRAALDWSWELLSPSERAALAQLSSFAGDFSVEDADAVLELPDDVWALDAIEALVDRSLVVTSEGRLDLLVSVRAYAREHLVRSGEVDAVHRRHADRFARHGSAGAMAAYAGRDGAARFRSLAEDRAEVVAALERVSAWGDTARMMPLLLAVAELTYRQGPLEEGIAALERGLALVTSPDDRVLCLRHLGDLCEVQGAFDAAHDNWARALEVYRQLGDRSGEGHMLGNLGLIHRRRGEHALAHERLHAALAIHRERGDEASEAVDLVRLGGACFEQWRLEEAEAAYAAAASIEARRGNLHGEAIALANLGAVMGRRGDLDAGRDLVQRAVDMVGRAGVVWAQAGMLVALAEQHEAAGDIEAARVATTRALALHEEIGNRSGAERCKVALKRLGR